VNDRRPQSEMDERILGQKNRRGACLDKTLASSPTIATSDYLPVTGSSCEYIADHSKSDYVTCIGNGCYLGTAPHHYKQETNEGKLNTLRTGSFKLFKHPFPGFLTILTL